MALDIASAEKALRQEREQLIHQLDELGAAETGDLRSDIDFGGSFADAASVSRELTARTSCLRASVLRFAFTFQSNGRQRTGRYPLAWRIASTASSAAKRSRTE